MRQAVSLKAEGVICCDGGQASRKQEAKREGDQPVGGDSLQKGGSRVDSAREQDSTRQVDGTMGSAHQPINSLQLPSLDQGQNKVPVQKSGRLGPPWHSRKRRPLTLALLFSLTDSQYCRLCHCPVLPAHSYKSYTPFFRP